MIPTVAKMAVSGRAGVSGAVRKMTAPPQSIVSLQLTRVPAGQDAREDSQTDARILVLSGPEAKPAQLSGKMLPNFQRSCSRPAGTSQPEPEFITSVLNISNSK